ncbi:type IV secretory system conjugative DNA transfer family protein, partial [Xanthomonas citri pv. citri]|nr:type IV secretory system conjugative DNA transfer family protein [Xanthomonas citri pv. citri]
PKGIIVGKWKKRFLLFPGLQFVLLSAPTRSGKGVGIVIPNLLSWEDSVVVLDVKQENFLITSGWRARYGHACYLFNPFAEDGRTHRYNPLGYISDDPRLRVGDILDLGYAIYPGDGKEPFFDDTARNLFLGLVLYLCETPELPRTFGELLRQASGKGKSA